MYADISHGLDLKVVQVSGKTAELAIDTDAKLADERNNGVIKGEGKGAKGQLIPVVAAEGQKTKKNIMTNDDKSEFDKVY